MSPTSCPICQSASLNLIISSARDYITSEDFQIWLCGNCQVAFTSPKPTDMSRYYPEKYRKYNTLVIWILELFYKLRAKRWSNWFDGPGMAFEMGCGNGIMLNTLQMTGWQVAGNERTISAAAFARKTFDLPVFAGELDALAQTPFVDLFFLFQVLEHLPDPISTLTTIHDVLKPNGKLVIGVPNIQSWQASFGRGMWLHLDVPRHLYHFSIPALQYCLEKTGFKIISVNFYSFEHDPYGWVQSILNRIFSDHNHLTRILMGLDRPRPLTLLHLLLGTAFGIISLPLSIVSWIVDQGAIMEVTAEKIVFDKE